MNKNLLWTALAIFGLDQISKYYVVQWLNLDETISMTVIPGFFNLIMAWNTGINFGLFSGGNDAARWVLIAIALVITIGVVIWMRREANRRAQIAAGLLVGGALGNVVDRVVYGGVADFLNMTCCGIHNPYSYNIADIAIFVGAIGLIFFSSDKKTR